MSQKLRKLLLLFGDIIVLYLSLYLTLELRYLGEVKSETWLMHIYPFSLIFFIWLIVFYTANLYSLHLASQKTKFYRTTANSLAICGLLAALYFYLNSSIGIAPKTNLILYLIIFFILFILWRNLFNLMLKSYLPKFNVAYIGYGNEVSEIISELRKKPHLGYMSRLILNNTNEKIEEQNIEIINSDINLKEKFKKYKISTVVINDSNSLSEELRNKLFSCLSLKIFFIDLPNFYESVVYKIPITAIKQMWFLENLNESNKKTFNIIKRTFDTTLGVLIFAITILFWPIIGLFVKYDSPGPVFYTQKRIGRNGRIFTMYKFRTMKVAGNHEAPTAENDLRITNIGNFLRKTRLDEIPQIVNVIIGDMSFVGPRPERPELVAELEKQVPFYRERLLVKPGLTGSDQTSGEYHSPSYEDTMKKLQYDLYYIKNRSLYIDLSIILRTIATVISKRGI